MKRRLLWIYNRTSKIRWAVLRAVPGIGYRVTLEIRPCWLGYHLVCRKEHDTMGLSDDLYSLGTFPTVPEAKAEAKEYHEGRKVPSARQHFEFLP